MSTPALGSARARTAYLLNAVVAWIGVVLTALLSVTGSYTDVPPAEPHLYGVHPDGLAGAWSRLADTLSYFTIWSNVVVAVSLTLLVTGAGRHTFWRRVLRLDGVLMITITAIVYAVLLAPTDTVVGWSKLTNPILHIVTPALTVLVWLAFGPRGWVDRRTVIASLAIPVTWIVYMLIRGEIVGAYPYGFANVLHYGYLSVAQTLLMILVFGLVISAIYWGIDTLLLRRSRAGSTLSASSR